MTALDIAITVAWLSSAVWLSMMGLAVLMRALRRPDFGVGDKKLIIQITTIGDDVVSDTVTALRRALGVGGSPMCEIWVVTEAADHRTYRLVDKVLTVPESFDTTTHTKFKARAHEFSRLYRVNAGMRDYKVLYIDDDSIVEAPFLSECFNRSFDLLQGTVTIADQHNILTYLDGSARAVSCLSLCSFFQELSHHLFTHGEGFCVDEAVDRAVSWDLPGWYAEDLIYGAIATRKMGFRMKSSYATVRTHSPVSLSELIKQRRRWFWVFVKSAYLLPASARVEQWSIYILGMVITPLAVTGIALSILGLYSPPTGLAIADRVLFAFWIGSWAVAGYYAQRCVRGVVGAAAAAMVAPLFGFFVFLIAASMGPVDTFIVMKRVGSRPTVSDT